MNTNKEIQSRVTWQDLEDFDRTVEAPMKKEQFEELIRMGKRLDFSTVPADVNFQNEAWQKKKLEALKGKKQG